MLMTDIIAKKRDGGELTTEEIGFVIDGYTRGTVPTIRSRRCSWR